MTGHVTWKQNSFSEVSMKVKVADANGAALDWMVAIAEGIPEEELYISGGGKFRSLFRRLRDEEGNLTHRYMTGPDLLFSRKWEAGGPVIDKMIQEGMALSKSGWGVDTLKYRAAMYGDHRNWFAFGETTLVAAMRCCAMYRLGDEVNVPKELL